jgi:putative phage-type endonuclease
VASVYARDNKRLVYVGLFVRDFDKLGIWRGGYRQARMARERRGIKKTDVQWDGVSPTKKQLTVIISRNEGLMKAKKLASTLNMTRAQWLELRRTGITGTRITGIMQVSPWETPRSVYLDLLGIKPEKEQTEPMYWGTKLEDIVAKEFAERTSLKVRRVNYMLQHKTYDFLLGNIDRLIVDGKQKGVLECKNVGAYKADEWKDGVPEHYLYQLQCYLCLTGLEFGYLAALIGGQKFVYHRVERDESLIEEMIEAATEFWYGHVQPRIEPPVTDRDTELLNKMNMYSDPKKKLTLDGYDDELIVNALLYTKEKLGLVKNNHELAVNQLKDKMRDAEVAVFKGEPIATWKADKNGKRTFKIK